MRAAATAIVLVLAGCAGPGPAPVPVMRVSASFPPGGIANVIVVRAVDRLALRSAELVAPNGKTTPANSIDVTPSPSVGSQRILGTAPFPEESFGATPAQHSISPVPLTSAAQSTTRLLAMLSVAEIPVPDPVAYQRNWQKYRIALRFGLPPGPAERRAIAAPPPLPGS